VLPTFGKAGFESNADRDAPLQITGAYVAWFGKTPEEVWKNQKVDSLTLYEGEYPVREFARMVAKIAYAYAVSRLGIARLLGATVVDAILGKTQEIAYWVGGAHDALPVQGGEDLHRLQLLEGPGGRITRSRAIVLRSSGHGLHGDC
jgi:hypothetical protein